MIKIIRVC